MVALLDKSRPNSMYTTTEGRFEEMWFFGGNLSLWLPLTEGQRGSWLALTPTQLEAGRR